MLGGDTAPARCSLPLLHRRWVRTGSTVRLSVSEAASAPALWLFQVPVCIRVTPKTLQQISCPHGLCLTCLQSLPTASDAWLNLVTLCSSSLLCFRKVTKVPLVDGSSVLCGAHCKMNAQGSLFSKQRNNAIKGTKCILLFFSGLSTFYGDFY